MQLIKRKSLWCKEGTSDKIYEADLCQVGDKYVVNFRYGRRGTNLKEGVKTEQPVTLPDAEKIFNKLIAEKVKKGYQEVTDLSSSTPTIKTAEIEIPTSDNPREQAILTRLANQTSSKWQLSRAIWRAGELQIKAATPLLINLLNTGDALRDYCIIASLGWCGNAENIPILTQVYQNNESPDFVKRIAFEAHLKLLDENAKKALQNKQIDLLPESLKDLAKNGNITDFKTALNEDLNTADYRGYAVLDILYQIDNEIVRPVLIEILKTAPFKPNYFQRFRHILKMAEYRQDGEIFGIFVYRLDKEKPMYKAKSWGFYVNGRYITRTNHTYNSTTRRYDTSPNPEYEQALKGEDAKIAFGDNTRNYLMRRGWRTLRKLGENGDINYVKMAANVLLQYSDNDNQGIRKSTVNKWQNVNGNWRTITVNKSWHDFAGYLTLNHILYENSSRYFLPDNAKAWRTKDDYNTNDPEPEIREEAFPELWLQQPEILLQLLLVSNCKIVNDFAAKALIECNDFCQNIDLDTLITLINKPYASTAKFGFTIARDRYNPTNPNLEFISALINCEYLPAREQVYQWIEGDKNRFLAESNLISMLVINPYKDSRDFVKRLLISNVLDDQSAKILIVRIIAALMSIKEQIIAQDAGEILLYSFVPQLRQLGMGVILDLLNHPLAEVQEIGARILLNHETPAIQLPNELIESLLNSSYENVRSVGVRIFGSLPDEILLQRAELLLRMMESQVIEIRQGMRPIIQRLSRNNPQFANQVTSAIIGIFLKKEKIAGLHKDLLKLLQEDVTGWVNEISSEMGLKLLKSPSEEGQDLGGFLLGENSDRWSADFSTWEMVKLGNHELLRVREAARKMILERFGLIKQSESEKISVVRLLESKWEDTRQFAQNLFKNDFADEDWTPTVMITICDSIKEDVRQFGRNLVTQYFAESYGQDYLIKFSEHPSADMQMFATNYLEQYASNNPERLRELKPYFITVLCQVNRGKVAKQRILTFLGKEAGKNEISAQIVGEILTRQSATMVIKDKAKALETMLKIKQQYAHIELPIKIKEVTEVRR